MFSKKPAEKQPTAMLATSIKAGRKSMGQGNSTFSIFGSDVTIKGDVNASVDLHVDGSVEGDIKCASLVQGESSTIHGAIIAESARMSGKVVGSITAKELVILKSAVIEGDVHYDALTIEQGAQVDGRFSPNARAQSSKPAAVDTDPQLQVAN